MQFSLLICIGALLMGCSGAARPTPPGGESTRPAEVSPGTGSDPTAGWQTEFEIETCRLSDTGRNPFFILEPGFEIVLEGGQDRVIITVLEETRQVDGHSTRVLEEREWKGGQLVEISRNFYALCPETLDVFYFGEEVDIYQDGEIVRHDGAWMAGREGALAGLIMPGRPAIGDRYYQEIAPGVAMDRAEVVSLDASLETPAGNFSGLLVTREGTALNPQEEEFKTYARGIGLIQDSYLLLTRYGFKEGS